MLKSLTYQNTAGYSVFTELLDKRRALSQPNLCQMCNQLIILVHQFAFKPNRDDCTVLLLTPTRVSGVKHSSAYVCVSVCLFVRTIEPKRLKLQTPNLSQGQYSMSSGYPFNIKSKGQRSRSHDHKVQKHISSDRVAGVSLHSIESSCYNTSIAIFILHVVLEQQYRPYRSMTETICCEPVRFAAYVLRV